MRLNTRNFQAGIDLGTTNSAIAVYDKNGVQLLDVGGGELLLPSCVYIDSKGQRFVGQQARNMKTGDREMNGHEGFKREMGLNFPYAINNLNRSLQPEELSGMVLARLREVYQGHYQEALQTAIVTVPAKFDLKPCEATRIAAMEKNGNGSPFYAGFLHIELLMEPIAASLAYGMNKQAKEDTSWLVFDLGGGTFDAAVVTYNDGIMDVKYHEGNNFLGGRNFDQALYKHILGELQKKYDLTNFDRDDKYRKQRSMLKFVTEMVKIQLSQSEEVVLSLPQVNKHIPDIAFPELEIIDRKGKKVNAEIVITRGDYNRLVGPIFQQSINICQNLMRTHKIESGELERVLLVGGPTQYPYFQEQIQDQLGIEVDSSIDPMTAVATGAAIHAVTQEIPDRVKPKIIEILSQHPTDYRVEDLHPTRAQSESQVITGRIEAVDGQLDLIESLSISRVDGAWESGAIPVDPNNGNFAVEAVLRPKKLNSFRLQLNGKNNAPVTITPEEFTIHHGTGIIDHVPYSLNVTVEGGKCVKIINKDKKLPAEGFQTFHTVRPVKKDDVESEKGILYVEITEGESTYAENNIHIGTLTIPNKDLRRDLPVDTEIEVTIEESNDRKIFAHCYIPFTKQSFEAEIQVDKGDIDSDKVKKEFDKLKWEHELKDKELEQFGDTEWRKSYDSLKIKEEIEQVEELTDLSRIDDSENRVSEDEEYVEEVLSIQGRIAEAKHKKEAFERRFVFKRVNEKLNKLEQGADSNGQLATDKIPLWRKELRQAQEENSYERARKIEEDMSKFDPENLRNMLCLILWGFTLSKEIIFIELLEGIGKEAAKYRNLEAMMLLTQFMGSARSMWEKIKSGEPTKIGPVLQSFNYDFRQKFNELLGNKDTYPIEDHDRVADVYSDNAGSIFGEVVINGLTMLNASGPVLGKANEAAQALKDNNLEVANRKIQDMRELYSFHPMVLEMLMAKAGDIGTDLGPVFDLKN